MKGWVSGIRILVAGVNIPDDARQLLSLLPEKHLPAEIESPLDPDEQRRLKDFAKGVCLRLLNPGILPANDGRWESLLSSLRVRSGCAFLSLPLPPLREDPFFARGAAGQMRVELFLSPRIVRLQVIDAAMDLVSLENYGFLRGTLRPEKTEEVSDIVPLNPGEVQYVDCRMFLCGPTRETGEEYADSCKVKIVLKHPPEQVDPIVLTSRQERVLPLPLTPEKWHRAEYALLAWKFAENARPLRVSDATIARCVNSQTDYQAARQDVEKRCEAMDTLLRWLTDLKCPPDLAGNHSRLVAAFRSYIEGLRAATGPRLGEMWEEIEREKRAAVNPGEFWLSARRRLVATVQEKIVPWDTVEEAVQFAIRTAESGRS